MKRKGFTLIELLAVIVIIAVIALVTIPLIGRVIENSKKGALTASASGIIEAAEIYYSTKMLENPETKTFTCSNEGCLNGEEKLDYKGQVSEGRVILYADGKVSICIEDGTNAALKLAEQSEITTEEGSCNYDSEDYSIDATVSKTKYDELQQELNNTRAEMTNGKKLIATSITNKGVETSSDATFEEMATNISSISTGNIGKEQLYESLQYSGLVTEDMTSEEMLATMEEYFDQELSFSFVLTHSSTYNTSLSDGKNAYASRTGGYSTIALNETIKPTRLLLKFYGVQGFAGYNCPSTFTVQYKIDGSYSTVGTISVANSGTTVQTVYLPEINKGVTEIKLIVASSFGTTEYNTSFHPLISVVYGKQR